MTHRFEINDEGSETLVLVFPPDAIRALAERLNATEGLHGPLPDMMQAPVRGSYTAISQVGESFDSASAGTF